MLVRFRFVAIHNDDGIATLVVGDFRFRVHLIMVKQDYIDLWASLSPKLQPSLVAELFKPSGKRGAVIRDYQVAIAYAQQLIKDCPLSYSEVKTLSELKDSIDRFASLRLSVYTPMLAENYATLDDNEKSSVLEGDNWMWTKKYDGLRAWLCVSSGKLAHLYGRGYSDKDGSLIDYADGVLCHDANIEGDIVLDVEVVLNPHYNINSLPFVGEDEKVYSCSDAVYKLLTAPKEESLAYQREYSNTYGEPLLQFKTIACVNYVDNDTHYNFLELPLRSSFDSVDGLTNIVKSIGIDIQRATYVVGNKFTKVSFLNAILMVGGEGVVAHNMDSKYVGTEKRAKDGFVKIKRPIGSTTASDTIDAYVSGCSNGFVEFSIKVGTLDDSVSMVVAHVQMESCYAMNRVAEFAYSDSNAKFLGWRRDKSADNCVYSQSFVDSLNLQSNE